MQPSDRARRPPNEDGTNPAECEESVRRPLAGDREAAQEATTGPRFEHDFRSCSPYLERGVREPTLDYSRSDAPTAIKLRPHAELSTFNRACHFQASSESHVCIQIFDSIRGHRSMKKLFIALMLFS